MADLYHEHDEFAVLDIADDPAVANCVAPISAEFAAVERVSKASRIIVFGKPLFQKLLYTAANDGIEFVDRFRTG